MAEIVFVYLVSVVDIQHITIKLTLNAVSVVVVVESGMLRQLQALMIDENMSPLVV